MVATFSSVVLAAGRSTRMGRDKALLEVDGVPLWQRQRDLLAESGAAEIFLSARPDQPWARRVAGFSGLLYDANAHCGPISGITAAIERATYGHVAVLAIDLPRMTSAWFRALLAECTTGVGVIGRRGDFFEPLAAIYPREMMHVAWQAIVAGQSALQTLAAKGIGDGLLRVHPIGADEAPWFENWNEPVPKQALASGSKTGGDVSMTSDGSPSP